MRPAWMLLTAALMLIVTWPIRAESVLFTASVKTANAEVRCQPNTSEVAYVTQQLKVGEPIEVVEKCPDGWLKIHPPKGSISWVKNQVIQGKTVLTQLSKAPAETWAVDSNPSPVPVLVQGLQKDQMNFIGTRLDRGSIVTVVGVPKPSTDGDLLPIAATAGEYRYIREVDVSAPASAPPDLPGLPTAAGSPIKTMAGASPQPGPNVVAVPAPAPVPVVDPLLQQANQLEKSGDKLGAARVYDQFASKYLSSNRDTAMQYYNRAAWLRATATPVAATPRNDADALYQQARQYEQNGNRTEAARLYMKLGDLFRDSDYQLAMKYYHHAGWLRQSASAPPANTPPVSTTTGSSPQSSPVVTPQAVSMQMIGPGVLRHSTYPIDGRPTYVLESPQAQVIAYLTAQPGVEMERYLNQNVELLGQIIARPDVPAQFMSVIRVRPLTTP